MTGPGVAETWGPAGAPEAAVAETEVAAGVPEVQGESRVGLGALETYAAALAGLPGMTPVRLAKLLGGHDPVDAWGLVLSGRHPADPDRRFVGPARKTDVSEVGERYVRTGVKVLLPDGPGYPTALVADPGAPAVLFALGDPGLLEGRVRVAIVGTRSATHYGRQVASELARELADSGVVVVSGLARGIDGAAHAGVLRGADEDAAAPPVAVVGTGLDVVYPSSNRGSGRPWPRMHLLRVLARYSAPPWCVPGPKSHHRRPLPCGRSGREPSRWGFALHGRSRRSPIRTGVCGAGLGPEPGLGRHQRPLGRRMYPGPRCDRRTRGRFPGPGRIPPDGAGRR